MSETVEFEISKQFENYIVIVKTLSENREKGFYNAYGKDALVFGYIMKQKIGYRNFRISKTFKNLHYFDKQSSVKQKMQRVFTSYSGVPLSKFQEMISVLNFYHINYIIVDKAHNYGMVQIRQFKDNKYNFYYKKGLYYKRILYKLRNINEFLIANSDSGEIMYLIYDIERCMNDYRKRIRTKEKKEDSIK